MRGMFWWHAACLAVCALAWYGPVQANEIVPHTEGRYYLIPPRVAPESGLAPVLICLPGWGVQAKKDSAAWKEAIGKKGFFLVALEMEYASIVSDEALDAQYMRIQRILAVLSARYRIDTRNVFVAGTTAGGMMALALSLRYPGAFKGAGVISGARISFGAGRHLENARGQSYLLFHGALDSVIGLEEYKATKQALENNGALVESKIFEHEAQLLPKQCYAQCAEWAYALVRQTE